MSVVPSARCRIHCLSPYTDGSLTVDGTSLAAVGSLTAYCWRALLLPGVIVVVDHPWLSEHLSDLREIGIGADQVIPVSGSSLFEGLSRTGVAQDQFLDHVRRSAEVEFFVSSPASDRFVKAFDIPQDQLRSPRREVMQQLDDKEYLRRLSISSNTHESFPRFRFGRTRAEIEGYALFFFDHLGCKEIFVKRPDLESGQGCMRVRPDDLYGPKWRSFLDTYATGARNLIIEESVDRDEEGNKLGDYSVQWYVDSRGAFNQISVSRQYIEPDGKTHKGNIIATACEDVLPAGWPLADRKRIAQEMVDRSRAEVQWASRHGLDGVGRLGIDYRASRTRAYKLEGNYRYTAGSYPETVRHQLVRSGRNVHAVVAMCNVYTHSDVRHPARVKQMLGSLRFNCHRETGVIPANILCLLDPHHPKFGAVCVGRSVEEAEGLLHDVEAMFGSRQIAAQIFAHDRLAA